MVDFEIFRPLLNQALCRSDGSLSAELTESRGIGQSPMVLFKILVLQALYSLWDEQAEFQIRERLSFMRFLGLGLPDRVPDYSTIWRFGVPPPLAREALVTAGAMDNLFVRFDAALTGRGYLALGGQMIDASIVEAPRQRLTVEEKQRIRASERPDWPAAKARHKDIEARWTVKRGRVKKKSGPALESRGQLTEGLLIPPSAPRATSTPTAVIG